MSDVRERIEAAIRILREAETMTESWQECEALRAAALLAAGSGTMACGCVVEGGVIVDLCGGGLHKPKGPVAP